MEISVETLINVLAHEEKELISILNFIKEKRVKTADQRIFNHIYQIAEQNVQFFERLNFDLPETVRSIQVPEIELEDYQTPVPKKNKHKLLTILIFILKSINNFVRLIEMLGNAIETKFIEDAIKVKIKEKQMIKSQVEKMYDQEILK